jgi:site-specific DNA recombinase
MARSGSLSKRALNVQPSLADNRVVSYVRFSTEDQVNSGDAQKRRHREFAAQRSLEIDETFTGEGVSATATNFLDRSEVKRMLAHMEKHGIRTVLLLRVDRVFRSTRDFNLSMIELEKRGVFLRFIDPDIDYSTPIGKMFIQQLVSLAEFEGQIRGQRQDDVLESLREKRVAIQTNSLPYGWEANGTAAVIARTTSEAKLAMIPQAAEQAVLRWLWDEYQKDRRYGCWTRLARALNAHGIPTKTGKATWHAATVQSVLEHRLIAEDSEIPGGPVSFEQAVDMLTARAAAA